MSDVRVLTLNALMRGDVRARLRALGGILAGSDFDVVCLQEVVHRGSTALLRRTAPGLRYRASTGAVQIAGGLVLLSRWPIVEYRFRRFRVTGPSRPEAFMRKGVQVARVHTPGGPLTVVNTHLSANRDDDWSPQNRYTRVAAAELAEIAECIGAADPEAPMVVVGDFNVPRDSAVLRTFAEGAGLHDVLHGDNSPTYRPTARFPHPPALDQVLIRPGRERPLTARATLMFQDPVALPDGRTAYLSDHYGIAARLTMAPGGPQ
jgi:endonuclease/exonuclease/phosphatase family metal-dependent hydrolase